MQTLHICSTIHLLPNPLSYLFRLYLTKAPIPMITNWWRFKFISNFLLKNKQDSFSDQRSYTRHSTKYLGTPRGLLLCFPPSSAEPDMGEMRSFVKIVKNTADLFLNNIYCHLMTSVDRLMVDTFISMFRVINHLSSFKSQHHTCFKKG